MDPSHSLSQWIDPWLSPNDPASPAHFGWRLTTLPVSVQVLVGNSTFTQTEQWWDPDNRTDTNPCGSRTKGVGGIMALLLPCSILLLIPAVGRAQWEARGWGSPLMWSTKVSFEGPGRAQQSNLEGGHPAHSNSDAWGSGGGPHPPHTPVILPDHLSTEHLEHIFLSWHSGLYL